MKSYTEKLHRELLEKLDELNSSYDPLNLVDCRLQKITKTIDQIKEKLKTYPFKKMEDEILYFKNVLPKILSIYFYYRDKMEWERIARMGTDKARFSYHDRIFLQAENFRADNKIFCEYIRDEKTDMDDLYFLRNSPLNREINYDVLRIEYPSTPPTRCELLAKYIAYTRLEIDSKNIIAGKDESLQPIKSTIKHLKWTGKVIDLVELGNGLSETGSFNDGNASKKEIFDYLEVVFSVKIDKPYRAFHDLVRRKGSSTAFLDFMKQKLLERIDIILK